MPTTQQDIRSFADFAEKQASRADSNLSIDELFDIWREANPSADELARSVSMVKLAIADLEAGDTGIPVDEHLARIRHKCNALES